MKHLYRSSNLNLFDKDLNKVKWSLIHSDRRNEYKQIRVFNLLCDKTKKEIGDANVTSILKEVTCPECLTIRSKDLLDKANKLSERAELLRSEGSL